MRERDITMRAGTGQAAQALFMSIAAWSTSAGAEMAINLPPPASNNARQIYDIHMLTLGIATVLMVIVLAIVLYSIIKFRRGGGAEPDIHFHESAFGRYGWLAVPAIVLGVDLTIAHNAEEVLEKLWEVPQGEMLEVKVVGHQWWWEYDYLADGIKVESRFTPQEKAKELYLREVDEALVLPTGRPIRFLHTSADVLHAFWVPALGFKKDAIPGYVTETWATLDKEGTYRGQCAELCGTWHSRMPIVVKVVSPAQFEQWVTERKALVAAAANEAKSDKVWGREELMARGKGLFENNCAPCHQLGGEGMPPTFPPLKGSAIATGPLSGHLSRVLNGKPGTAMQSWAHLSDIDIAACVTYERNAFGNNTGDVVQPAQVAAARGSKS